MMTLQEAAIELASRLTLLFRKVRLKAEFVVGGLRSRAAAA